MAHSVLDTTGAPDYLGCVQPKAGHMMMLEDPATFCRIVESILYDGDCRSGA